MSKEDKIALKKGQFVRVRDDLGKFAVWEVKYAPWQVGNGTWVIGLKGKAGGYDLDRVVCVELPLDAAAKTV